MNTVRIKVRHTATAELSRGHRWFSSLARVLETNLDPKSDGAPSFQHSLQFYGLYARTGDKRYLKLCDDFLRSCLSAA